MNNLRKCNLLKKRLANLKINKKEETELVYKDLLEDSLKGIVKLAKLKETKIVV